MVKGIFTKLCPHPLKYVIKVFKKNKLLERIKLLYLALSDDFYLRGLGGGGGFNTKAQVTRAKTNK